MKLVISYLYRTGVFVVGSLGGYVIGVVCGVGRYWGNIVLPEVSVCWVGGSDGAGKDGDDGDDGVLLP